MKARILLLAALFAGSAYADTTDSSGNRTIDAQTSSGSVTLRTKHGGSTLNSDIQVTGGTGAITIGKTGSTAQTTVNGKVAIIGDTGTQGFATTIIQPTLPIASVANNGTTTMQIPNTNAENTGACLLMITDNSNKNALFHVTYTGSSGQTFLLHDDGQGGYSTTAGTSGKSNVTISGTGVLTIENKTGGSDRYSVTCLGM